MVNRICNSGASSLHLHVQAAQSDVIEGKESQSHTHICKQVIGSAHFIDEPANVTLLGDAIHSITQSLGRGTNLAMRHGALLGRHLKKVAQDEGHLTEELASFEKQMTEYGFKVVRAAAEIGRQCMDQNSLDELGA